MNFRWNIIVFLGVFTSLLFSQSQYRFQINNINLPIDNRGTLADVNIPPGGAGAVFGNYIFLFSSGFLISGFVNDTLWAAGEASASLIHNFIPGNVDSSQYDPRYILYVVDKSDGDFAPSWEAWRFAVSKGAKFYDGNNDGIYDPVDLNGIPMKTDQILSVTLQHGVFIMMENIQE